MHTYKPAHTHTHTRTWGAASSRKAACQEATVAMGKWKAAARSARRGEQLPAEHNDKQGSVCDKWKAAARSARRGEQLPAEHNDKQGSVCDWHAAKRHVEEKGSEKAGLVFHWHAAKRYVEEKGSEVCRGRGEAACKESVGVCFEMACWQYRRRRGKAARSARGGRELLVEKRQRKDRQGRAYLL